MCKLFQNNLLLTNTVIWRSTDSISMSNGPIKPFSNRSNDTFHDHSLQYLPCSK